MITKQRITLDDLPPTSTRTHWALGEVWEIQALTTVYDRLRTTRFIECDILSLLFDVTMRGWERQYAVRFRGDRDDQNSVLEIADLHIEDFREGCADLMLALIDDQRAYWDWDFQMAIHDDPRHQFAPRVSRYQAQHALHICKSVLGLPSDILRFPEMHDDENLQ